MEELLAWHRHSMVLAFVYLSQQLLGYHVSRVIANSARLCIYLAAPCHGASALLASSISRLASAAAASAAAAAVGGGSHAHMVSRRRGSGRHAQVHAAPTQEPGPGPFARA